MCEPVSIIMAAVAIIGSVAANRAANKAAKAQAKAIGAQNQQRAQEIADAAGQQLDVQARAARKERAAARVSAAESGINLGSNSFLAMLQDSEVSQSINSGVIVKNAKNQQLARDAQYKTSLAGIQYKTGLGIALDAAVAGASAYSGSGGQMYMGRQPGRG